MPLTPEMIAALKTVSTATLAGEMARRGVRNVWIGGVEPLQPGQPRVVGPAFTMRYMPNREDLRTSPAWDSHSPIEAIEEMPAGAVVVVEGHGTMIAGIVGDVMSTRMNARGVVGLVSDGVLRDRAGITAAGLPVWAPGYAAPGFNAALVFASWQVPVSCAGVTILPGETIVLDDDGAVVIPDEYLEELVPEAVHHERLEEWIIAQVAEGAPLPGLYPPSPETTARYDAAVGKAHA